MHRYDKSEKLPTLAISVQVELNVQVELECSSLDAP